MNTRFLDSAAQDLRFAARTLRRQKAWTAVAVITLALGIGANSAMFSVVNHLLLNPIPYPHADRIVVVYQQPSEGNTTGMRVMVTPMSRVVAAWREHARSFDAIEPYVSDEVTLDRAGGRPQTAHSAAILPSFVGLTGQHPLVGRMFTSDEAKLDAGVVLLSEGMWRREYGSDPAVVGKTVRVNRRPMTIIGVMPGVFQLPRAFDYDMDLWMPLSFARHDDDGFLTVARLRPGVSRASATKELDAIAQRPEARGDSQNNFVTTLAAPSELVSFKDSLLLLTVAVGLVLLIACANVAHLLLARASTRQREMAIRAALGAGTQRLFRQLLSESFLLSVAGCLGGLAVGWFGLRLLVSARPENLSELAAAKMDGTTVVLTLALSVATALVFGVIGAIQAARHSTHDALKSGSLTTSGGRRHGRLRSLLVVSEMALCTMLLIGATLLLRSVAHLQTMDPGFNPEGLYAIDVTLPSNKGDRYAERASRNAFYDQLLERVRQLPGMRDVATAAASPPMTALLIGALQTEGQPDPPAGVTSFIPYNGVSPDFFRVMGMRILQGTGFTDTSSAAGQVIVNEGMAHKHWGGPGQSPLGRKLRVVFNAQGEWKTIVGVVANASTRGLTAQASDPMLYMAGTGFFRPTLIVRTSGATASLQALRDITAEIDPSLSPPRLTNIEDAMTKSILRPRFTMLLLLIFTIVAVGLAAIGLYGVLAYTVAQRTREIGIRMALGASRRVIARAVLSQGLALAAIGAVIGVVATRGTVKLISSVLYGVQPTDLVSFTSGGVLLVVIAALACLVPIRRALAVDPLIAMRAD